MGIEKTYTCDHPGCKKAFVSRGTTSLEDNARADGWVTIPEIGGTKTFCPEHAHMQKVRLHYLKKK